MKYMGWDRRALYDAHDDHVTEIIRQINEEGARRDQEPGEFPPFA
jgi:hypothetical protein